MLETIRRASNLLNKFADALFRDNTMPGGAWPTGTRATRNLYFELRQVAKALDKMAAPPCTTGETRMLKAELIAWASRLGPDEDVFPLRAQDICAARVVENWAHLAAEAGAPTHKVNNALATAERMAKYPHRKIPD